MTNPAANVALGVSTPPHSQLHLGRAADGVVYVSTAGNDGNSGNTWGTAKATVQAAIDALPAHGGVVFIGAGTFTFAVTVQYRGGVTLWGAGSGMDGIANAAGITKLVYTGTGDAINADTSQGGFWPSVQITHLQLDTNAAVNLAASALHIWNAHDFLLEDVVIGGNFTDAILLDSGAINSDNVTFRNVRVEPFGGGRFITRGLRVPAGSRTNQALFDRVLFNIGDGLGVAAGRGDTCVRIDGTLANALFLAPGFITATNGLATSGAGNALNVWVIAPHIEGAIVNQFNLINAADQVAVIGLGGVGAIGAWPAGQGFVQQADGRIRSAVDGHVAQRIIRNSASQTADMWRLEKENTATMILFGPKGQLFMQPDDLTNPLVRVLGPASGSGNLAEFQSSGGNVFKVRTDGGLSHPAAGLGFYGANPVATRPAVTGSRGANAALASLLTQLASLGLVTDSTTP